MRKTVFLSFLFAVLFYNDIYSQNIQKAVPVWAEGREKEMNVTLGFRAVFAADNARNVRLKIAASTLYRVFLNGEFIGSGPARAAHGYFRIDEYKLEAKKENVLAIEVAGYNVNSYYTLDQPSFLMAEVSVNGKIVRATGNGNDFEAFQIEERLQKVERYSFQRPFTEYYRMKNGYDRWRNSPETAVSSVKLKTFEKPRLLPRHVLMPDFNIAEPVAVYAKGVLQKRKPEHYYKNPQMVIGPQLKGYTEEELEITPVSQETQELFTVSQDTLQTPVSDTNRQNLKAGEFYTFEFGVNLSGFIGIHVKCAVASRLFLHFDELLTEGDVLNFRRQNAICNVIVYELAPGEYRLETMETYTLKYLKAMVVEGDIQIEKVYLREFAGQDNKNATFNCSNPELNKIFDAARQTSRQTRLDIFMDNPSRERAGWTGESYIGAVMEKELTGYSHVADNVFENWALPESFDHLPEGMIPMCYPADHYDGNFIPQGAMGLVFEIEQYINRGGDRKLIDRLKPRVEKVLNYFSRFENEDGLLENLEGWQFVEWSASNNFVHNVNYPTNMIYYTALRSAANLYQNKIWDAKAKHVKETIIRQSFNGKFFTDNAVRENGKLQVTNNRTEFCQYAAFYYDIVNPDSHPELWHTLVSDFGPNRDTDVTYPEVFRCDVWGNLVRTYLLSRYDMQRQMLSEVQAYYYAMADKTGTMWEFMQSHASCNQGSSSFVGHLLYRGVLGISHIDYVKKEITIRFPDIDLDSCSGSIPIGKEKVTLRWQRSGETITYSLKTPRGYKVKIYR